MQSSLVSVNVGVPRMVMHEGEPVTTSIFKESVSGRVRVAGVNVEGDDQADRSVHGGPVRAIYVYASEDYAWWEAELERSMPPGTFGENFTTRGIDVNAALIGERWRVGSAVLQVTIPRIPCYKLAIRMDDRRFIKRFGKALRPGPYLTIVEPGEVGAGDSIEVIGRPAHDLTIAEMTRIYLFERARLAELLVPELPEPWREWVAERVGQA